jgi:hypothetical protein
MRESTIAARLIGFMALGGCAKVRYPDYYVLNLPNPVSASRDSGPIPARIAVREFRAPPYLRREPSLQGTFRANNDAVEETQNG